MPAETQGEDLAAASKGERCVSDRELLEQAAKAAGLTLRGWADSWSGEPGERGYQLADFSRWNPLTDDGDALRLAVKLGMHCVGAFPVPTLWLIKECGGDHYAATRRAIVNAAAAIAAEQRQDERAK